MDVNQVISKRVEERGISFSELARRVSMNGEVVRRICRGDAMPKGDQLIRLCMELDLDIEDFTARPMR